MKEQIDLAINWIKEQPIRGCITGSCLLDYFEGQDIDVFVYDEGSFNQLIYAMHYNPLFTITDPVENWKFKQFIDKNESSFYKFGLITIKFTYNTCIPVNIIIKKSCKDVFSVMSSFDMDIICKAYDLQTKKYLDLTNGSGVTKVADWNSWNVSFYSEEIWKISRVLRQLERAFKYHKRGYNTDNVVKKYMELLDRLDTYENIFASENFKERLKVTKKNTKVVKKLCTLWLETHEISDEQIELLKIKIKEM